MDMQELAKALNGRTYRNEITAEERKQAKAAGLVVMTGSSDDLVSLYGAAYDDTPAGNGTRIYLSAKDGLLRSKCDCDDCPYFREVRQRASFVDVTWDRDGWSFKTSIPHATFNILDEGTQFSKGIVYRTADLVQGV